MRHLHGAQCRNSSNGPQSQWALLLLPRGLRLRVCCCVPLVQQVSKQQNPHLWGIVGFTIPCDDLSTIAADVARAAAAAGGAEGARPIFRQPPQTRPRARAHGHGRRLASCAVPAPAHVPAPPRPACVALQSFRSRSWGYRRRRLQRAKALTMNNVGLCRRDQASDNRRDNRMCSLYTECTPSAP